MTQEQFNSFVRLVRKMNTVHLEAKKGANGNSWPQYFALCSKVDGKLFEFTSYTPVYYPWQLAFVTSLKELRKGRKEFEITKYESQLERCEEMEHKLTLGLNWLEENHKYIFTPSTPIQEELFS